MFYFLPFLYCFFVILSIFNTKWQKILLISFLMVLVAIISLQSNSTNRDGNSYFYVFSVINNTSWGDVFSKSFSIGQEFGFLYLMKICSSLGFSFYYFRFFVSLLTSFFIFRAISRVKDNNMILLCYFLYFSMFILFRDFTQIRFGLGCAFSLNFFISLSLGKKKETYLFLIFALLSHNSTLCLIPFLFLYKKKFSYNFKFLIFSFLLSIIFLKFNIIGTLVSLGLAPHQLSRYFVGTNTDIGTNTLGISFIICLFILFLIKIKKTSLDDPFVKVLYLSMLLSANMDIAFYGIPILMRMADLYFTVFIFLPFYFYNLFIVKSISNKNIIIFLTMIFFVFYYFHILKSGIVYQYNFL